MANLPKIAMQRLHQKSEAGVHPDPNLISAFAENSLPREARAQVLEHIAQCADCRDVVFLASPDQAALLPALVATPSSWLTWPVLRWGAAVAAVVVVVGAVTLHRQSGRNSGPPGTVQMTDAPSAKENAAVVSIPQEKRDTSIMTQPAAVPPETKNELGRDADVKVPGLLKKQGSRLEASPVLAQKAGVAAGKLAEERKDELDKATTVEVAGEAPVAAQSVTTDTDQVVPGRAKNAPAAPASGVGGGMMAGNTSNAAAVLKARPALLSAMGAPRWTLTSDGTLQRSVDFGRSWQTVEVASQGSFRALAASGRDIWVGGSKGALYHSTDAGQSWTQVQPVSSGQTLSDDIIGVEFPDTLHGKVNTANKQTWTTEDGGQTWRKQ